MHIITPADLAPIVRIANHHPVFPGQSWDNRRIPDLQMILIVAGKFEYCEGEKRLAVQPGDVLLIEPGVMHTFRYCEASLIGRIAGIHLELVAKGAWAAGDYRLEQTPEAITRVGDVPYLQERFERLAAVFADYSPFRNLLLNAIAHEIVLVLMSHWRKPANLPMNPRMQEMIKFIRDNLQQPISRQQLAAAFGLSPEYINLLFRRELGMTPSAVVNRERVMLAYHLINEQGHTVTEAAFAAGFSDPFYFSRVFKQILGVPPSQVR